MKNKLILTILLSTLISSFAFCNEEQYDQSKQNLIESQIDFVSVNIDRKCQKIKKKIERLEDSKEIIKHYQEGNDNSHYIDYYKYMMDKKIEKIQRYEKKLEALRELKSSINLVNIKDLTS